MTQQDVLEKLQTIFDDLFMDKVEVKPELTAQEVEEWDSLLHITLVVSVEKAFKIRFHVGEVEATRNVGEFSDLILKRQCAN